VPSKGKLDKLSDFPPLASTDPSLGEFSGGLTSVISSPVKQNYE